MTLPYERSRAVILTRTFLQELSRDHSLPEDLRGHAKGLLRHYPDDKDIFHLARLERAVEHLVEGEPIPLIMALWTAKFDDTIKR